MSDTPKWQLALFDRKAGMKYADIAVKYGVSVGTVKSWASRYWKDTKAATKKKKVADKKVANKVASKKSTTSEKLNENSYLENGNKRVNAKSPKTNTNAKYASLLGNKNAYGNKGGKGGPPKNKFALKTGEYETIFFTPGIIDADEMALLGIEVCKYNEQSRLVKSLRIREMRMYVRIAELKNTPGDMVLDSVTKNKSTTTTQYHKRDDEGGLIDGSSNTVTEDGSSHVSVPVLAEIMKIEEALTRVQGRLQRAIEVWHKMELDDSKLAIDEAKLDLYRMRITGQIDLDELVDDDDFEGDIDDAP